MGTTVRDEIGHDHPALAGHFPGNPVVPGVLVLQRVFKAVAAAQERGVVTAVPSVRFHAPLRPGEAFDVELAPGGGDRVGFRVVREGVLIASGTVEAGPRRPAVPS